jgi:CO dehydrogenase maturation factor
VRGLIAELVSSRHQVTITDMEAGLEHLSRSGGTLRYVDQLLIITEMDRKALETARRTFRIAQELGIVRIGLIGNKLRDESDRQDLTRFCIEVGVELVATIPYDDAARQADRRGVALYDFDPDAPTVRTLKEVVNRLEGQFELTPASPPLVPDPQTLSPEERKKRFPECD